MSIENNLYEGMKSLKEAYAKAFLEGTSYPDEFDVKLKLDSDMHGQILVYDGEVWKTIYNFRGVGDAAQVMMAEAKRDAAVLKHTFYNAEEGSWG